MALPPRRPPLRSRPPAARGVRRRGAAAGTATRSGDSHLPPPGRPALAFAALRCALGLPVLRRPLRGGRRPPYPAGRRGGRGALGRSWVLRRSAAGTWGRGAAPVLSPGSREALRPVPPAAEGPEPAGEQPGAALRAERRGLAPGGRLHPALERRVPPFPFCVNCCIMNANRAGSPVPPRHGAELSILNNSRNMTRWAGTFFQANGGCLQIERG